MSDHLQRFVRTAALALAVVAPTLAGTAAGDEGLRIRVERVDTLSYPLVRFVTSVTDASGRPVAGLTADHLRVSEGGVAVPARVDLASQTTPVALAFVIDTSASMAGAPLQQAISATIGLSQRLGPRDQAAVITFRDTVEVVQPLTADKQAVAAGARSVATEGALFASWDAFSGALATAVQVVRAAPPGSRGAIVLVTDGFAPTSSTSEKQQAIDSARASLYPIYPVAVGAQLDTATFRAIAAASRGRAFFAPSPAELAAAYGLVGEQILTQYSVEYATTQPGSPGEGRTVKIQLVRDGGVLAEITIAYAIPAAGQVSAGAAPSSIPVAAGDTVTFVAPPAQQEGLPTGNVDLTLNAGAATALLPAAASASLVAMLGAAAVLSLFLFVANGVLPSATKLRLERFVARPKMREQYEDETAEPASPVRVRVARSVFSFIGTRLAPVTPRPLIDSASSVLQQAGDPAGLGPVGFLGLRAVTAVASAAAAALLVVATGGDVLIAVLCSPLGLAFGFIAPVLFLRMQVRSRTKQILRSLPSTVDILALSVEAGLAFDGAIAQIVLRRKNAIADEFRRVLVEFQMGRPRKEVLRELAGRCGVPEVGRMTNAVIQADALGSPLGKALSDLAQEMRVRRRQRAEELARTAPIKMLFPMVGLIFPSLFIIILGPAVPRLMNIFSTVGR